MITLLREVESGAEGFELCSETAEGVEDMLGRKGVERNMSSFPTEEERKVYSLEKKKKNINMSSLLTQQQTEAQKSGGFIKLVVADGCPYQI